MGSKGDYRPLIKIPSKGHIKSLLAVIISFAILGSLFIHQSKYFEWRNRMEVEVDIQTLRNENPTVLPVKYDMFMYIGCTISPFAAAFWHFNQAVKVCDASKKNKSHCTVKLPRDYTYDELGFKANDWLRTDEFRGMMDRNEVIVKTDDDTIIAKDILDGLVSEFVNSTCQYAGNMRVTKDGLYWSNGPLFMVKSKFLKEQLEGNSDVLYSYAKAEDVQMGALLDIRDEKLVCNVDLNLFRHRFYEDKRLSIRYNPYIQCLDDS